jgi:hypothetical protein
VIVCYLRLPDGGVGKAKPVLFGVRQSWELRRRQGSKWQPVLDLPPDSPLRDGRPLGAPEKPKAFQQRWEQALAELLAAAGLDGKSFRVYQGCVVEKEDGERLMVRNFKAGTPWFRPEHFRNIRRVHRSPLAAASAKMPE